MKYEAVFGSQVWFEHQNNEYVVAFEITHDDESTEIQFDTEYPKKLKSNETIIAMRRIIQEPKRWTVEDQKAGRLPEVGCIVEYFKNNEHADTEVTAQWRNGDELEILRHQNKNKAFVVFNARAERSSDLIVQCMKPIETPKEKAQREEDGWVNKAWGETAVFAGVTQDEHDRLRIHLRHIYKAQLSGELAAPKGGEL